MMRTSFFHVAVAPGETTQEVTGCPEPSGVDVVQLEETQHQHTN